MGQSPWFLLQWSQAEAHSLVSLSAGRHREHQWYPGSHQDRPSFPVPLGPGPLVQKQACLRSLASPSVSCSYTDGMPVSLSLSSTPQKAFQPRDQTQGSVRKHISRTVHPGSLAHIRHIVVVAVGLLGSLSPGQCQQMLASRVRHGCQC